MSLIKLLQIIGLLIAGIFGGGIFRLKSQNNKTQKLFCEVTSYKNAYEFINNNYNLLRQFTIGWNLSPTHLENVFKGKIGPFKTEIPTPSPQEIIDIATNNFDLGPCRFPIYIDKCLSITSSELSFDYYNKWFDAFFSNKVSLWLNAGIKTARWPEIHINKKQLVHIYNGNLPRNKHIIKSGDQLLHFTLNFQTELANYIKSRYKTTDFVEVFQVENEPYAQFGEFQFTLSDEALKEEILNGAQVFPTSKIMINCPPIFGYWDKQNKLLIKLQDEFPNLKGRLISGINQYTIHPYSNIWDTTGKNISDSLFFADLFGKGIDDSKEQLPADINVSITELQMEPWYGTNLEGFQLPGNDMHLFWFTILRSTNYFSQIKLSKLDQHNNIMLVWGTEELIRRQVEFEQNKETESFTQHHKEIINTIRGINQLE